MKSLDHIPSPAPKILMLHGHGQSGESFQCKTRFLEQPLITTLKNQTCIQGLHRTQEVEFFYPSGLLQADPDSPRDGNNTAWAWGYGDYQHQCIRGIEDSIRYLIRYIDQHGPFIGIMGFSSGAALAAIITSLYEGKNTITGLKEQISHPPFLFGVCFSGFKLKHSFYKTAYQYKVQTPILHVIGILDSMICPSDTHELVKQCENAEVFKFYGTHQIPRKIVMFPEILQDFAQRAVSSEDDESLWVDEF